MLIKFVVFVKLSKKEQAQMEHPQKQQGIINYLF